MSQLAPTQKTVHLDKPVTMFVPFNAAALQRADDEQRIVEGSCYGSARVGKDNWNLPLEALQRAATSYLEFPALREMHQAIAAGTTEALHFDADTNRCDIVARVVDDAAWNKVKKGVYKGFSLGGKPKLVRGADIVDFDWWEISLVDRPADPQAKITVWRSEGAPETEQPYDVVVEEVARAENEPESPATPESETPGSEAPESTGETAETEASQGEAGSTPDAVSEAPAGETPSAEDVERGQTSATVPARENLERDGKPIADEIEALRQKLLETDDGSDTEPLIRDAIGAALKVLNRIADGEDGSLERGTTVSMTWEVGTFKDRAAGLKEDQQYAFVENATRQLFWCLNALRNADAWHQNINEFASFFHQWIDDNKDAINMPASPDSASSETVALRAALGATLERLAAEPKPNEEPAAGEAGVLPTGVLQRIEQLETNYGRLAVVNQDLLQRVETAESERESATLERDAALTDKDRLGGELSVVRSDLETAREQEGLLQRSLSDATGTVQRLEGQVTKLEHDVTQLAEQELPRPPISNAQAVERTFVANDLLENQAQDAEQHLERLNSEQKTLEEQLKTIKGDRARTPLLTRMIAIEQERTAISRSLQLT
jgi:hypothetical protein